MRGARHLTEAAQLALIRRRRLSDAELLEVRNDPGAGIARELADDEIGRRAGLTTHERIRETLRKG